MERAAALACRFAGQHFRLLSNLPISIFIPFLAVFGASRECPERRGCAHEIRGSLALHQRKLQVRGAGGIQRTGGRCKSAMRLRGADEEGVRPTGTQLSRIPSLARSAHLFAKRVSDAIAIAPPVSRPASLFIGAGPILKHLRRARLVFGAGAAVERTVPGRSTDCGPARLVRCRTDFRGGVDVHFVGAAGGLAASAARSNGADEEFPAGTAFPG